MRRLSVQYRVRLIGVICLIPKRVGGRQRDTGIDMDVFISKALVSLHVCAKHRKPFIELFTGRAVGGSLCVIDNVIQLRFGLVGFVDRYLSITAVSPVFLPEFFGNTSLADAGDIASGGCPVFGVSFPGTLSNPAVL